MKQKDYGRHVASLLLVLVWSACAEASNPLVSDVFEENSHPSPKVVRLYRALQDLDDRLEHLHGNLRHFHNETKIINPVELKKLVINFIKRWEPVDAQMDRVIDLRKEVKHLFRHHPLTPFVLSKKMYNDVRELELAYYELIYPHPGSLRPIDWRYYNVTPYHILEEQVRDFRRELWGILQEFDLVELLDGEGQAKGLPLGEEDPQPV
ncbi:MAG: hypothetical protein ACK5O7_06285 [Holosporales bacterium]